MIVENMFLLKTPLDSEYKNIIDFNNYLQNIDINIKSSYFSNLLLSFESGAIRLFDLNKSIKVNNKLSSIVIPRKYNIIKDCNYLVIYGDDEYYFFFVTGLISENDNENNPSTMLSIKWDAWANNIDKFTNNTIKAVITQKHYDRYYKENDDIKPYFYQLKIPELITTKQRTYVQRYQLLLAKCIITKTNNIKCQYNISSNHYIFEGNVDTSFLNKGKQVLYIPICMYDNEENKFFSINVSGRDIGTDEILMEGTIKLIYDSTINYVSTNSIKNELILGTLNRRPKLSIKNSEIMSYIEDIRLTYYSPVKYNYIESTNTVLFNLPLVKLTDNIFEGFDNYTFSFPRYSSFTIDGTDYYTNDYFSFPYEELLLSENHNIDTDTFLNKSYSSINFSSYGQYTKEDDVVLLSYPFNYLSTYLNNDLFIFNPVNIKENKYRIEIDNSTYQPKLNIYDNNSSLVTDKQFNSLYGTFLNNSGTLSYSINAKDDYLIRNGTQNEIRLTLNRIKTALGVATGMAQLFNSGTGIQGIINTGMDYLSTELNYQALLNDLKNTPMALNNSNFGEDDIYVQDRIILMKNLVVTNTPEYKLILDTLYLYGYNISSYDNILHNSRVYFDYIQTENCIINISMNNDDKKELENAFNRGIFKNHINYGKNINNFDFIRDGSKNNCELTLAEFPQVEEV